MQARDICPPPPPPSSPRVEEEAIITFPSPFSSSRASFERRPRNLFAFCLPDPRGSEGHGVNTMSARDTPGRFEVVSGGRMGGGRESERLHQHREGDRIRVFVLYEDYQPVRFHLEGWHPRGAAWGGEGSWSGCREVGRGWEGGGGGARVVEKGGLSQVGRGVANRACKHAHAAFPWDEAALYARYNTALKTYTLLPFS